MATIHIGLAILTLAPDATIYCTDNILVADAPHVKSLHEFFRPGKHPNAESNAA